MKTPLKVLPMIVAMLYPPGAAHARRPRGTPMTGVIQSVDHSTRWITFARDDCTTLRFVYGKLARFWHGTPDSSPAALRPGMSVRLNRHNPLFGPDYASRLVLIHPGKLSVK
ncbi:MAG: hypothetical protein V4662_10525 [Verrucomicrobiota bacterium]